ncbi:MAG: hypothetical protein ACI857_002581 [Arenicella sp.]|jgi:hypothetical protein
MSKEFKNIDELFKAELGGTSAKAPAHVKANIDKALGLGGRKKLLWLLLPVVAILISLPFIYNANTLDSAESNLSLNGDQNINSDLSSSANDIDLDNEIQTNTNSQNGENTNNNEINSNSNSNSQNNNELNQGEEKLETTSSSASLIISDGNLAINDKIYNPNNDKTISDGSGNGNGNVKIDKDIKTADSKTIKSPIDPNLNIDDKDNNAIDNTLNIDVADKPLTNNQIDSSLTVTELPIDENPELMADSVNTSNPLLADNNTIDSTVTEVDSTLDAPDINLNPPNEDYQPWFVSATAGINLKNSNMIVPASGDTTNYFHDVTDKIGHSAQIELSYRLKNSLTFGGGIGYTSLIENYSYFKSQNVLTDTINTWVFTQDSIQDSLGFWTYWQDSTQQTSYNYADQEIYNANGRNINTYLNIPIRVGTQLDFGKLRLDLFAMGRFNLLLRSQTTYVENDQIVVVPKGSFKNSYFDLIIGSNIHYNLFGNLYVTGTLRYQPPMRKTYYPSLTNKFQNMHVGVGFSLGF